MGDPRDASGYSADDVLSMGFLSTSGLVAMLESTMKLSEVDLDEFDVVVVCRGWIVEGVRRARRQAHYRSAAVLGP